MTADTNSNNRLNLLFQGRDSLNGEIRKENKNVGHLSLRFVGEREHRGQKGITIELAESVEINQPKVPLVQRKAFLILSSAGKPMLYHSEGTGGDIELDFLADRVLITTVSGQRFVRYAEDIDFVYEEFFPIHEWLAFFLCSETIEKMEKMLRCFSTTLLRVISYKYHASIDSSSITVSSSSGQKIWLDKNSLPIRIDMNKKIPFMSSIIFQIE